MSKFVSMPVENIVSRKIDDSEFVVLKLYAISTKPNRNDSEFLRESFEKAIPTFYNKPILAFYNPDKKDVEEHNGNFVVDEYGNQFYDYQYPEGERPCGVIPESASIYVETVDDRDWIVIDGALVWVEYNRQLAQLLFKQGNKKVSVEVEMTDTENVNGIERAKEFKFLGITILGDDVIEGISNAHLEVKKFSESNDFNKFKNRMSFALKEFDNKTNGIIEKYFSSEGRNNMALTHRELEEKMWAELSGYTYEQDDYTNHKYWIEDILTDENKVVVRDNETKEYYIIPYHVDDENKLHIDMSDKKVADKRYQERGTYSNKYSLEAFIAKKDWGKGETVPVNKSEKAVSKDSWGSVKKTELRNKVLEAKNYKRLVKDVYLLVEDGWEDSPSSKLKYPVMQFKDGEFVYNEGGLLSAQQYGEKYDEAIATKAKRIRKKLGLLETEKRDNVKKYIEQAKDAGLVFIGQTDKVLKFVKEAEADEEKKEMSVFEIEKEKACDDKEFAWDELTEKSLKMADKDKFDDDDDDDDDDNDDHNDDKPEDDENVNDEDKKELARKYRAMKRRYAELKEEMKEKLEEAEESRKEVEAKCEEFEAKCEETEKELEAMKAEKFKEDTDAILSDEDEDMDEKIHEELKKMIAENKFNNDIEAFRKEMAYLLYTKKEEKKEYARSLSFSLDNSPKKKFSTTVADPDMSELDKI